MGEDYPFEVLERKPNTDVHGEYAHVKTEDGRHYRVSHITEAFDTGEPETLVFPADEDGDVVCWGASSRRSQHDNRRRF